MRDIIKMYAELQDKEGRATEALSFPTRAKGIMKW